MPKKEFNKLTVNLETKFLVKGIMLQAIDDEIAELQQRGIMCYPLAFMKWTREMLALGDCTMD